MAREREASKISSVFSQHPGRMPTPDGDADPEEWLLAWDPSLQIPVADRVDLSHPLVNLNQVKYPGKRKALQAYLRPLAALSLPGQGKLERYVLYKYRRNMKDRLSGALCISVVSEEPGGFLLRFINVSS